MEDKFKKLNELKQLLEEGYIDDQEYSQLKKELLEDKTENLPTTPESSQSQELEENQEQVEIQDEKTYCPNCGSNDIQMQKNAEVNWGRAVAGWALFGIVGGAVGAVTGKEKNSNVCLNCGTVWNPSDLYKSLQTFESLVGIKLNLKHKKHRVILEDFMSQVGSHLETIAEAEKITKQLVKEQQKVVDGSPVNGYLGASIGLILPFLALFISPDAWIFFTLILTPLGFLIGLVVDLATSKSQKQKKLRETKAKREKVEQDLKASLNQTIEELIQKHQLKR